MTRKEPVQDETWGLTYMGKVHLHISCLSCDFITEEYLGRAGEQAAENHHRETGHELEGEVGFAVWVGAEGNRHLKERARKLLGSEIVDRNEPRNEGGKND